MFKQLMILLAISVLLGTAVARGVAEIANGYFHNTMDSLVGSYGEFDFIVQTQQEKSEEAKVSLDKVMAEHFAGGYYQEAPAIGGRANFFVTIPRERKTKEVYERIDSYFAVLPGAAGLSIISEPRLSIRGVPTGAIELVRQEIEKMDGVWFVFLDGPTIHVMLADMERSEEIQSAVERLLASYRVWEVRFNAGAEPPSPVQLGETMARNFRHGGVSEATYVSIDETSGEEAHLLATLGEMRDFLTQYRTRVTIVPDENVMLTSGEKVRISGQKTIFAEIETVDGQQGHGVIVSGDASETEQEAIVYRMSGGKTQERIGTARLDNPRIKLAETIEIATKLVSSLSSDKIAEIGDIEGLRTVVLEYERFLPAITRVAQQLAEMDRLLGSDRSQSSTALLSSLRTELGQAIASLDNTRRWLNLAAWANDDIRQTRDVLQDVTEQMSTIEERLAEADERSSEIANLQAFAHASSQTAEQLTHALERVDSTQILPYLEEAERVIRVTEQAELSVLMKELKMVMGTLPNMRDDDLTESIRMIDKLVAGYLVPNKKIQILTTETVPTERAMAIIRETVGHEGISISESALGVIEPNTYLEVYRMLYEVKRILAGMTAMLMTGLFLALDHTTVISMMKLYAGRYNKRDRLRRMIAYLYGALIGAVLLTVIFYLSGGGIPYVPFGAVPIFGILGGVLVAIYSERISPVSEGEIMAGESLGMDQSEILSEIVIPSGRPGLSLLLNRYRLRFK